MAPSIPTEPASKRNGVNDHEVVPIGPSPGLSSNPPRCISEQTLQQMLKSIGYDEAREDAYRLKGVQLIDSVRQSISLCGPIASKLYLRILLTSATGRSRLSTQQRLTTTGLEYGFRAPSTTTKM